MHLCNILHKCIPDTSTSPSPNYSGGIDLNGWNNLRNMATLGFFLRRNCLTPILAADGRILPFFGIYAFRKHLPVFN
jgi:hypothetical protein